MKSETDGQAQHPAVQYATRSLIAVAGATTLLAFCPPSSEKAFSVLMVVAVAALGVLAAILMQAVWNRIRSNQNRMRRALLLLIIAIGATLAFGIGYLSLAQRTILRYGNEVEQQRVIVGFDLNDAGRQELKTHPEFGSNKLLHTAQGDASRFWTPQSIQAATVWLWTTSTIFTFMAVATLQVLTFVIPKNRKQTLVPPIPKGRSLRGRIQAAVPADPAMGIALGVAGIAGAAAIVYRYIPNPSQAWLSVGVMLAAMVILIVVGAVARRSDSTAVRLSGAIIVFSLSILFVAACGVLFFTFLVKPLLSDSTSPTKLAGPSVPSHPPPSKEPAPVEKVDGKGEPSPSTGGDTKSQPVAPAPSKPPPLEPKPTPPEPITPALPPVETKESLVNRVRDELAARRRLEWKAFAAGLQSQWATGLTGDLWANVDLLEPKKYVWTMHGKYTDTIIKNGQSLEKARAGPAPVMDLRFTRLDRTLPPLEWATYRDKKYTPDEFGDIVIPDIRNGTNARLRCDGLEYNIDIDSTGHFDKRPTGGNPDGYFWDFKGGSAARVRGVGNLADTPPKSFKPVPGQEQLMELSESELKAMIQNP